MGKDMRAFADDKRLWRAGHVKLFFYGNARRRVGRGCVREVILNLNKVKENERKGDGVGGAQ